MKCKCQLEIIPIKIDPQCPVHGDSPELRSMPAVGDPINHPPHYNTGNIEVISAIEDWELGFHLGNVVKYVARAGKKGSLLEDLLKARWYLDRMIQNIDSKVK